MIARKRRRLVVNSLGFVCHLPVLARDVLVDPTRLRHVAFLGHTLGLFGVSIYLDGEEFCAVKDGIPVFDKPRAEGRPHCCTIRLSHAISMHSGVHAHSQQSEVLDSVLCPIPNKANCRNSARA